MDAYPSLVRLEILALEKTNLVGRHHRRSGRRRQIQDRFEIFFLLGSPGALQLQIKAFREQLPPLGQPVSGLLRPVVQQRLTQLALTTAGQGDQTLGVTGQPAVVDHRHAALLAFEITTANQPGQVAIAGQVLAQQHQPRRVVTPSHPYFHADDRFDSSAERGLVELDQRKQVAHVGDRHGRHPGGGHLLDQALDADQPIHQRVFGVQAQMHEGCAHPRSSTMAACSAAATGAKERRCSGQGP